MGLDSLSDVGSVFIYIGLYMICLPLVSVCIASLMLAFASITWTTTMLIAISLILYVGIAALSIVGGILLKS